ncbi:MAG: F-type H+-transporting ATPase subunit a [Microbacteriaceae bacterium]|nr:F-type H+-transporting ATPase subunit a [Microbacteriaceae bacterium]
MTSTGVNEAVTNVAINITPGEHIQWHLFGMTLNADTMLGTLVAGLIVIGLGLWMRHKASVRQPSGLQLFFETVTEGVEKQVEESMGVKTAPFVVPLAMTLFLFILVANLLALIPTGHHPEYMPPPASDVNLTYALALTVIVWMHIVGIKKKGFRGYYHHLFQPYWFMFPINVVEELAKPITLALRLFGNIFSGVIMVSLIAAFPAFLLWAPDILWKLFDAAIGLVQAFIFALLTVLYFASVKPAEEGAH